MRALFAGVATLLFAQANAGNVVYTFKNVHPKDAKALVEAECKSCGTGDNKVDVWKPDGLCADSVHNEVPIPLLEIRGDEELVRLAAKLGVQVDVKISDLSKLLELERPVNRTVPAGQRDDYHTEFHTFSQIATRLQTYATQYGATYVNSMGSSWQGTAIPALRFGSSANNNLVFLQCGIHAREWISPATCMYVIEQLLDDLQNQREPVYSYLNTVEVYVIPVVNPDGYEFTWASNRMWRKNRRANAGNTFGVDLNRNWDDHWGLCGSSTNPGSDTYRGTAPFSEPETHAVQQLFTSLKSQGYRIQSGIDVHSFGQLILRPYGWILPTQPCPGETNPPCVPPNDNILGHMGDLMKDAIYLHGGHNYTSEHAAELYCAAGGADDWIASNTEQASGFCLELRDTGAYGFVLPANQIIPTGIEIYQAYVVYLREVINGLE